MPSRDASLLQVKTVVPVIVAVLLSLLLPRVVRNYDSHTTSFSILVFPSTSSCLGSLLNCIGAAVVVIAAHCEK